ncbi:MAG: TatD family hydrolase [Planctomycetota bacterium]|jgi:TatD DNase family protein
MIVDTHAHLQWPELADDLDGVLARAAAAGVERAIVIGTDLESSDRAAELARNDPRLSATAGVHPCSARDQGPGGFEALERRLASGTFVAVGETGLDQYHNGLRDRAEQLDWFDFQLDLARRLDLPAVIHCRDAFDDVHATLKSHPGVRGVLHCFSEGPREQDLLLELGLHISFAGPVTRKNASAIRDAARRTPADRLLVETDSPFLPPRGFDSRHNEPRGARLVLEAIAALREESVDDLAARTTANARSLFGQRAVDGPRPPA